MPILYFDGACRGNPGESAAGWVIYDDNRVCILADNKYLGHGTNNTAEATALLLGLVAAANLELESIQVRGDSQLVIQQAQREWKINNQNLLAIYTDIWDVMRRFRHGVVFNHVDRSLNAEADRMANQALDSRSGTKLMAKR